MAIMIITYKFIIAINDVILIFIDYKIIIAYWL